MRLRLGVTGDQPRVRTLPIVELAAIECGSDGVDGRGYGREDAAAIEDAGDRCSQSRRWRGGWWEWFWIRPRLRTRGIEVVAAIEDAGNRCSQLRRWRGGGGCGFGDGRGYGREDAAAIGRGWRSDSVTEAPNRGIEVVAAIENAMACLVVSRCG